MPVWSYVFSRLRLLQHGLQYLCVHFFCTDKKNRYYVMITEL